MLSIYPESDVPKAQGKTIWWNVRDPSPAEVAEVKKAAGIEVPSREALSEIETSSRLKARDGVLSMSVPMVTHAGGYGPQIAPAVRSNKLIRARLRQLGRLGDYLSEKRDALLALGRAIDFACELTSDWAGGKLKPRMAGLKQDVASLDNYEVHLSDKVQFLLDAMVGLIGIAQNDIFKILTIVSIVGIPPTLIAGIYGMNFKFMPEYDWMYGYPYGLALIVLSAIVPLVWFKWRGWF
ncbi:CorA family divalent cation transporter [Mesorhizobium carmichaelinearum]|uniref:CorA family divalent cation transporter n=1 Tax=Mesorhizobium carmichaelinearum TaxID=1208188 RepID=UPI000BA31138|nr:CorA family divalent cation transporter [Mesorhizobium carmichaelinearum]